MRTPKLTDAELDDFTEALGRFRNARAMNLEELDGFIAALICGPSTNPTKRIFVGDMGRW